MSSGQEATCDCAGCVSYRGGTWEEVTEASQVARAEAKRAEEATKLAVQTTNWAYRQPFPLAKD